MGEDRNAPCPCGSGRKYKKCCLGKDRPAPDPLERLWQRVNEVDQRLPADILRFGKAELKLEVVPRAREEYAPLKGPGSDFGDVDLQSFVPWTAYCWRVPDSAWLDASRPTGRTMGEEYLARRGSRLDPFEKRLLEACVAEPFSFWEVLATEPGRGVEVEDVFRGSRLRVSERSGSEMLGAGEIVWGRVISIDGLSVFSGMGSVALEPEDKIPVIDLAAELRRRHRRVTTDVLREEEAGIRGLFLRLRHRRLHPTPPILHNTDDELIVFHSLRFRVDDPHEAFEGLTPLDLVRTDEEALMDAKKGPDGRVRFARIDWHKAGNRKNPDWDNTILGHLTIDGTTLVAEVNSEARAKKIRKEVEKRLRGHVTHVETVVTPVDRDSMQQRALAGAEEPEEPEERLDPKDPEVRRIVEEAVRKHYTAWVDMKIPSLGGRTPRQAVKSAEGRAKVEALLKGAESRPPSQYPGARLDLEYVREILGIGAAGRQTSLFDAD